jgi:plastocyanin
LHAKEMQAALQRNDLTDARRHAEHLINLVEGKHGSDYGDTDGNGNVEDPGDGTGALVYLDHTLADGKLSTKFNQAATLAGQIKASMLKMVQDAWGVTGSTNLQAAAPFINDAVSLTGQIKNNPDGLVIRLIQLLNLTPAEIKFSNVFQSANQPASTVIMKDLAFNPKVLIIKQGTQVTFRNLDQYKHTVTSDTGLFDSRDLDAGQSFTFKFDQVGTFPYYCVFHGYKGGVGMSGVIQVEP